MCTSPLLIKQRNFRYLVYSRKIVVPCGECPECLRKKANDLYLRAKLEYDCCIKNGGCGFMCCLTYSDDLLPTIEMNGRKVMVFNKKHVIDFIKRLRVILDREYKRLFHEDAPDFKYLVTSEYGTDPTRSHRPHYHLLIFFRIYISPAFFRECFIKATYCRIKGVEKRYFGKILQCDLIDPKKGGIRYSAKYVCKDIMYKPQNDYIRSQIRLNKIRVECKFHILQENTPYNDFHNKCIRSRKDYKKCVEELVRPWRHMLQFFMLSNDLGASYAVNKYGSTLESMPCINFDGFPFAVPTQIKIQFEKKYGKVSVIRLVHSAFCSFVSRVLQVFSDNGTLSHTERRDLQAFADNYVYPLGGRMRVCLPADLDCLCTGSSPVRDWEDLCNEFEFYDASDFLVMRDRLEKLISEYNSPSMLEFRARLAQDKTDKERKDYVTKKRNSYV